MRKHNEHPRQSRSNCYNCGKTVYGESEANAGGHVFCCRKCRAAWERDEARRRALEAEARRRAEEERRVLEENARIAAEKARRWEEEKRRREEQCRLERIKQKRRRKMLNIAGVVVGFLVFLVVFPVFTTAVGVVTIGWWHRKTLASASKVVWKGVTACVLAIGRGAGACARATWRGTKTCARATWRGTKTCARVVGRGGGRLLRRGALAIAHGMVRAATAVASAFKRIRVRPLSSAVHP